MSYFTYHGKLGDELIVAVLPNGTVEADDPIYIYTDKKAMAYTVRYNSVTDDGDDKFTFHDGYYEFEAIATKAYQSLSLTRKAVSNGKTAIVALTRQYSQPQTVTPQSNSPKIWTGTINFHSWAKEEPFVIVAPKGLGNEKPVVAIWQWTKDDKGVPNTLSHSTEKQTSSPTSPTKFSFKQAGHYDVTCQVNIASNGLAVTVKDATNTAVEQKELVLLPQNTINAEHRFNPPRGVVEKKSLDCSRPNAKPSLPRITEPLPFPEDLVDCLAHVAAYVDRAGYHAKFSQKQFDKLDRAFHLSEEKVEKRDTAIVKLKGDVARLETEKKDLKERNDALDKKIIEERKEAAAREAKLQEQLQKALEDLRASQGREKKLEKENSDLRDYIKKDAALDAERQKKWEEWKKKDAADDARREKEWKDHDKADHEALKQVQKALMESIANGKRLSDELIVKDKKIADLQSSLEATKCELETARAEIDRLNLELVAELAYKVELQQELEATQEKLRVAEKSVQYLTQQFNILTIELADEKKESGKLREELKTSKADLKEANRQLENAKLDIEQRDRTIKRNEADILELEQEEKNLKNALKELTEAHDSLEVLYKSTDEKLTKSKSDNKEYKAEVKGLSDRLAEMRKHDDEQHKKPVVAVTEIALPS
ncbi:hypothetical protein FB567DRAFT_188450 [Paraphoma chrysanthemicola]|uniref:Uncharacterized protein n=1 Tax=Paraphoma chrysanthemicola TaxID=798071 RepID=A0A8K0QXS7_9PLEO|nr:hypothetical protein FB567DRAFT_188450 [Paraphoma chrysanthemicola]